MIPWSSWFALHVLLPPTADDVAQSRRLSEDPIVSYYKWQLGKYVKRFFYAMVRTNFLNKKRVLKISKVKFRGKCLLNSNKSFHFASSN
jgi:hypothetical protein